MDEITWDEFQKVELRAGTIVAVSDFPEARKPAWKLKIDFGEEIGIRNSSAQIVDHYTKADLLGKQIVGVINFPIKQIGPFQSESLTTGFYDDTSKVVLISPDKKVPNGAKLA